MLGQCSPADAPGSVEHPVTEPGHDLIAGIRLAEHGVGEHIGIDHGRP